MKMHSLGCKTIEDGMVTALIFLLSGISIILAGYWIVPDVWYLAHIIIVSGLLILLMVPLVLIATYIKNSLHKH